MPLYLYLAFNAPHTPYQAPQADLDRYKNIADPSRRAYAGRSPRWTIRWPRRRRAREEGHARQTIIVFQSDNGGTRNAVFRAKANVQDRNSLRQRSLSRRQGITLRRRDACHRIDKLAWTIPQKHRRGHDPRGRQYPTLLGLAGGNLEKKSRSTAWTWGRRSARASRRREPKSSITLSLSGRCPARRLEADLANAAAGSHRALQCRRGPFREEQCRGGPSRQGRGVAEAGQRARRDDGQAFCC